MVKNCLALRKDAVIDSDENFKDAALLGSIACSHEVLRRPPAEDVTRRVHPTARFGFIAESFQRAAPNGVGAMALKLLSELFRRRWAL